MIHLEVQARSQRDFPRRMFQYYAFLSVRYAVPVFPVVLYLRGGKGLREEEYRLSLFGREQLRFRYESVGLESLSASEYVGRGPLGAALSALMDRASVEDALRLRADVQGDR